MSWPMWKGWGDGDRQGIGVSDECPAKDRWGRCKCSARCLVCGFRKHYAVHMVAFGAEPGSAPCDHEYAPERP